MMKFRVFLLLVIGVSLAFGGCREARVSRESAESTGRESAGKTEAGKTEAGKPEESVNSTPMQQGIREVILYTMSTDEMVLISEEQGDEGGLLSVVDDFDFYGGQFQQNPGIPGLEVRFTDEKEVVVKYSGKELKVVRDKESDVCGAIFNDGIREPKVVKGVMTDDEYREVARAFFKP